MSIIGESLGISKESLRYIQGKMLISEKKRGQNRINNRSGGGKNGSKVCLER